MSNLIALLNKEKSLHKLLNSPNCPSDIDEQFKELFKNQFYKDTNIFFEKNKVSTMHDGFVKELSQKKKVNEFSISFKIDSMPIYSDKEQIGYITNSQFKLSSNESLRDINNKCILNFLIDEENKEMAFYFIDNNQGKVIGIKYNKIEFIKGTEILYGNPKSNKMKM